MPFDPEDIKRELDELVVISASIDQVEAEIKMLKLLPIADPSYIAEALARVEWNRKQIEVMVKYLKGLQ